MNQNDTELKLKPPYIQRLIDHESGAYFLYSDGSHRSVTKESLNKYVIDITERVKEKGRNTCEVCDETDLSKCRSCCLSCEPNPEAFTRQELVDALWDVHCYTEALTPSGDTKAAYIGEFKHVIYDLDENGEEQPRSITVPWTTIKDIMKAIRDRADSHRKPS